ncbi:MAG: hypothetical protein UT63_C0058G0018 [Candidatus Gottesmanbacteria bacterium GW2011_GWC2_39_8]|uniref:Transcriptional repressor PaaX-like central Cas2-like domain-containing protein n=1 Tax=Candidatus Gottesmanbacteria bacterium GW2011_GWC2_39_8 TaxID=1618450 RepID=A0A0G0T222_9BACT|nr:MAG: hypothetical protein UT63_C0058G0018 [Candidatus Gottesmanbacteria bacterium GW2011_GWC2_39_8]
MGRKKKEIKEHITRDVLISLLKAGIVLGVAVVAPKTLKVVDDLLYKDEWKKYFPSSIDRATNRLLRKGVVRVVERGNQSVVVISEKGKTELLKYDLEKMEIEKQNQWDKKWRIVIFDVPNKYRKERDYLREKLVNMGFYPFQESVFICPYPCEKEIKFIREVLTIPHEIKYIVADRVENDEDLRKIFKLSVKICPQPTRAPVEQIYF